MEAEGTGRTVAGRGYGRRDGASPCRIAVSGRERKRDVYCAMEGEERKGGEKGEGVIAYIVKAFFSVSVP